MKIKDGNRLNKKEYFMNELKDNRRTETEGMETPLVGYSHIIGLIAILFIICFLSGR